MRKPGHNPAGPAKGGRMQDVIDLQVSDCVPTHPTISVQQLLPLMVSMVPMEIQAMLLWRIPPPQVLVLNVMAVVEVLSLPIMAEIQVMQHKLILIT